MKKFKIRYTVIAECYEPNCAYVNAETEEEARDAVLSWDYKKFYKEEYGDIEHGDIIDTVIDSIEEVKDDD